jgi:hypothetical protein
MEDGGFKDEGAADFSERKCQFTKNKTLHPERHKSSYAEASDSQTSRLCTFICLQEQM